MALELFKIINNENSSNIRIASPTPDYSNTPIVYDGNGLTLVILTVIYSLYTHQTVDYHCHINEMDYIH
jgi:hypothetical protein